MKFKRKNTLDNYKLRTGGFARSIASSQLKTSTWAPTRREPRVLAPRGTSWRSRPVPETGTPVNMGNQPHRDNGDGVAAMPLPYPDRKQTLWIRLCRPAGAGLVFLPKIPGLKTGANFGCPSGAQGIRRSLISSNPAPLLKLQLPFLTLQKTCPQVGRLTGSTLAMSRPYTRRRPARRTRD